MKTPTLALVAALATLPAAALAQGAHHGGHSGHSAPAAAPQMPDSAATKAYRDANARMHRDMDIKFSGDADIDFVRGMIPHHQGAIDMARVALEHSKDEQVRKWAADVVREQEREIAEMKEWLRKRGALQ
ncbi:CopM family metallochaperone [Microvirga roseola]|uniref:CopM family metallochaperone n=1 Tax=Microvirga roseola TaxID=2883126 RepID=UPI001E48E255|nr:DUF305 domain-containing protein [Microvirga roseola]